MPSNVDGNGYYRCLYPGRALASLGHGVAWVPHQISGSGYSLSIHYQLIQGGRLLDIPTVLLNMDFDVLFMGQREEPWIGGLVKALTQQGKRVVVDCDDDWLSASRIDKKSGFKSGGYNPASRKSRDKVEAMLKQLSAASHVTVSTPTLESLYSEYNDNVTVIRNGLDWDMWKDVERPATEKVRVGWMGDLQWRRGDLDILRGVIGPWVAQNDVEFVAAGDPEVHDYLAIPKEKRVSVAPTPFYCLDLPDITATFDIGLVPLAKNPLNEGKSHLKGLEYGACGIPYIASPSESYNWFTDGNGLIARNASEWRQCLDALLKEPRVRKSMGQRGRELAEQTSVQERAHEWEDAVCVSDRNLAGAGVAA